jgi:hypothetical protein
MEATIAEMMLGGTVAGVVMVVAFVLGVLFASWRG